MSDPAPPIPPDFARLKRIRGLTMAALLAERVGRALWPAASWTLFFVGLWILSVPAMLSSVGGPAIAALLFWGGLFFLLYRGFRDFSLPGRKEIDRRIERASLIRHRPLQLIGDRPASPKDSPAESPLWQESQHQARRSVKAMRSATPAPVTAALDPFALRLLAVIFICISLVVAGSGAGARISAGLFPFSFGGKTGRLADNSFWISPPAYTGVQKIILGDSKQDSALSIPQGSVFEGRVARGFFKPSLIIGKEKFPFTRGEDKSWTIRQEIGPSGRLTVRKGPGTLLALKYGFRPDTPPVVTAEPPELLPDGSFRLPVALTDDYGVKTVTTRVSLAGETVPMAFGTPFEETKEIFTAPGAKTEIKPVYDLTWHPWAGFEVNIEITATDELKQTGKSAPLHFTLPEKQFRNPVALEIVHIRQRLLWSPKTSVINVPDELAGLASRPALYNGSPVTFLALKTAAARLYYKQDTETIASVASLLWDTAVEIEDGQLPLAARNLREAQEKLSNLLNDPQAGEDEIAQAMDELREALAGYFEKLAQEMQKSGANGASDGGLSELFQNLAQMKDFAQFLDKIQGEAMSGDRRKAANMLSELGNFMEQMNSVSRELPPQMTEMMENMNRLQSIIERQQSLLEQTRLAMSPEEEDKAAEKKDAQNALRLDLGQCMADPSLSKDGKVPNALAASEQSMRAAEAALAEGDLRGSLPHQQAAIDHLQEQMNEMSQQLQEMVKNMTFLSFGAGTRLDPLGRPLPDENGMNMDSDVKLPSEAQRRKIQEILETLRARSGQRERPGYERDYYERLMRQF